MSGGATQIERLGVERRLVCFILGDNEYGVPIDYVQEVVECLPVTFVPEMPHYAHGVITLRGAPVPLLDPYAILGLPSRSGEDPGQPRQLVIGFSGRRFALPVDEMSPLRWLGEDASVGQAALESISQEDDYPAATSDNYIMGLLMTAERPVMLLNWEKLLSDQSLQLWMRDGGDGLVSTGDDDALGGERTSTALISLQGRGSSLVKSSEQTAIKYRLLSFRLGRQEFSLPIEKVREVASPTSVTLIPLAPDFIRGVINLRGKILPLVNLYSLLIGNTLTEDDEIARHVIVEDELATIAIEVHAVPVLREVEPQSIEAVPPSMEDEGAFLSGIISTTEGPVLFLDWDKVIGHPRIRQIGEQY